MDTNTIAELDILGMYENLVAKEIDDQEALDGGQYAKEFYAEVVKIAELHRIATALEDISITLSDRIH